MSFDMPLAELYAYRPPLETPDDFAAFWAAQTALSDAQPLNTTFMPVADYPVKRVRVHDVRFDGIGAGARVAGWYLVPTEPERDARGRIPTIIIYHGYTASRFVPSSHLLWALQGYAVFAVDTRGQNGDTPDGATYPGGSVPGFMTRGMGDPATYYYRHAFLDCLRAVKVLRARDETGSILLCGGSQGGGLALATASLAAAEVCAVIADQPFLTHYRRSIDIATNSPYNEFNWYWRDHPERIESGWRTLHYMDTLHHAPRITQPVLLAAGLADNVCPPSTAFAVYNHLGATIKRIAVYPYLGHEPNPPHQEVQIRFARTHLIEGGEHA